MKRLFDAAVQADNFAGTRLFRAIKDKLDDQPALRASYRVLLDRLEKRDADYAFLAVIRSSFLIELVKTPKIETTKFEVRWGDRLGEDDPRYSPYDECLVICRTAMAELAEAVADEQKRDLLTLFCQHHLVPYEIPFDYAERVQEGRQHHASNFRWFWDAVPTQTVRLRHFLLSEADDASHELFDNAYKNKIKVKIYLTDRVLTGAHKTNREKRWETHPGSVHFALRRDCLDIERTLIEQLCDFEGFPQSLYAALVSRDLIRESTEAFRCPVTMEALSFPEFEQEIRQPDHGRARFQVGHLNPLKAVNDDPYSGHTAQNISWISADGNRIQGSMSLGDVRALIRRISENYDHYGVE